MHASAPVERFAEPLLIGPRQWYEGKVDCEVSHVEGTMIQTLQHLTRHHARADSAATQPIAVAPCDILPSSADFQRLLDEDYAPHADTMFWWQMIEGQPAAMGAGAWKPSYHLPPTRWHHRCRCIPATW